MIPHERDHSNNGWRLICNKLLSVKGASQIIYGGLSPLQDWPLLCLLETVPPNSMSRPSILFYLILIGLGLFLSRLVAFDSGDGSQEKAAIEAAQ